MHGGGGRLKASGYTWSPSARGWLPRWRKRMSLPGHRWLQSLQSTSLFSPAPQDAQQRQMEALGYVDILAQFTSSASFLDDINELVRGHYPKDDDCLLDEVLAHFVLHQPEHGHTVLHALLSCVIDGTLSYSKEKSPFCSIINLFDQATETVCPDQWTLACGETLRFLTHYNRPVYKADGTHNKMEEATSSGQPTGNFGGGTSKNNEGEFCSQGENRVPMRLLTPWITDSLLAAPLGMRRDYFQWCGGIVGTYAVGGQLRPPSTVGNGGEGNQRQLLRSTARWGVANGAAVILSVCDDEVLRYQSADLTAAAVPALLLPPEVSGLNDHQVARLPPLEPYAHLFHRYYGIATPETSKELLLGLLQAPSSWVPDAPDAVVQLVVLLRAAEDVSSAFQLPQNWLHLHFLHPIGVFMQSGVAAEAAAALLLQIISQPVLLFPPHGHVQGVRASQAGNELPGYSAGREEIETSAVQANEEATACGLASLMTDHGSDVERRICSLWDVAYGLRPLDSPVVDIQLVAATPLQRPILSWNLFRPLLRVLEQLPRDSLSERCVCQIFAATVEAILQRTFSLEASNKLKGSQAGGSETCSKSVGMAELRSMVHWLFTEMGTSPEVAARLLADALTHCLSHDALRQKGTESTQDVSDAGNSGGKDKKRTSRSESPDDRGVVATFDSYVIAAVCALACEVQMVTFFKTVVHTQSSPVRQDGSSTPLPEPVVVTSKGIPVAIEQTKRVLGVLEALLLVSPSSVEGKPHKDTSYSDIVAAAVVAAHVSALLGKSRACLQAIQGIVRSKWDVEICSKASSVLALVQQHVKAVAEMTEAASQSSATEAMTECESSSRVPAINGPASAASGSAAVIGPTVDQTALVYGMPHQGRPARGGIRNHVLKAAGRAVPSATQNTIFSGSLNVVLTEKQEVAVAIVPLIWQRLMLCREAMDIMSGSSSPKGWCQFVEALCKLVVAFPVKVTAAIILKANREIRPWASKDGIHEEDVWNSNTRIVTLLTELLRMKRIPLAVQSVAKSSNLLLQSTDGLNLEGEACVLPQLELLETAAMSVVQQSPSWDVNVVSWSSDLMNMLKERIPGVVYCLSHPSSHARALSIGILRNMLVSEGVRMSFPSFTGRSECGSIVETIDNWKKAVEEALRNEAHRRRARGLSVALLSSAASALGLTIPT